MKTEEKEKDWKIVGFDSFDMTWYPIDGTYATEEEAEKAALARLKPIPIGHSDIQDRVFVEGPDGEARRVHPSRIDLVSELTKILTYAHGKSRSDEVRKTISERVAELGLELKE